MSLHWKVRCPLRGTEPTTGAGLSLPKSTSFCSDIGQVGSQGTPPSLVWLRIAITSADGSSKITLWIVWDAFHLLMSKHLTHIIWWHSSLSHSIKLKVKEHLKPSTKQSGSELTVHRPLCQSKPFLPFSSNILPVHWRQLGICRPNILFKVVFFFSKRCGISLIPRTEIKISEVLNSEIWMYPGINHFLLSVAWETNLPSRCARTLTHTHKM